MHTVERNARVVIVSRIPLKISGERPRRSVYIVETCLRAQIPEKGTGSLKCLTLREPFSPKNSIGVLKKYDYIFIYGWELAG